MMNHRLHTIAERHESHSSTNRTSHQVHAGWPVGEQKAHWLTGFIKLCGDQPIVIGAVLGATAAIYCIGLVAGISDFFGWAAMIVLAVTFASVAPLMADADHFDEVDCE